MKLCIISHVMSLKCTWTRNDVLLLHLVTPQPLSAVIVAPQLVRYQTLLFRWHHCLSYLSQALAALLLIFNGSSFGVWSRLRAYLFLNLPAASCFQTPRSVRSSPFSSLTLLLDIARIFFEFHDSLLRLYS